MKIGELTVEVHEHERREEKPPSEEGFKNLYIKSFPKDWDDDKLREVFGVFGEITAVATRKDWKDRPFGFVDFANAEDAKKCIEAMHLKEMRTPEQVAEDEKSGKVMEKDQDDHPLHLLYVGRFQKKSERQAAWAKEPAGKGSKGGAKGKGGWGGKDNRPAPDWSKGWGGKGGKGGKPMGYPGMGYPMMGGKGAPMVANPQQMMAMYQMHIAKGGGFPGMKGGPMMGKGKPIGPPPEPMQQTLTIASLQGVPPAVQKQMIGERLFRKVATFEPDLAAKITGMMLEMDNAELIVLLESEARLKRQVDQAVSVLKKK